MTISVTLNENVSSLLSDLLKKSRNSEPALDIIGQRLSASTLARFNKTKTAPDGTPWRPSILNTNTLVSKRDEALNKLRNITHSTSPKKVIVGTTGGINLSNGGNYARIHQLGGKAGRNGSTNIVARPYLGVSEQDKSEIEGVLNDFFRR